MCAERGKECVLKWRERVCGDRGAEAGGILGVNTPHFLEPFKKWKLERAEGVIKNLGGEKKFLGG